MATNKTQTSKTKVNKNNKEESKDLIETKVSSPLNQEQLVFVLQKTPKEHIYERPAKGGGKWEYVTGVYIKKVLNYCFGWRWDFEVKEHGREGSLVWVLGRLTIKNKKNEPIITKEQFGRAEIKFKRNSKTPLDFGNDLKAATTDALKKCASELGIASDIYGKNEFKDIQKQDKGFVPPKEKEEETDNKRKELKSMLDGKTDNEKRKDLAEITGIILKDKIDNITEKHAGILIAQLLNKKNNK